MKGKNIRITQIKYIDYNTISAQEKARVNSAQKIVDIATRKYIAKFYQTRNQEMP